jgi:hypothetical protein
MLMSRLDLWCALGVNFAPGNQGKGRGCFKCGEEGHFAKECPNDGSQKDEGVPERPKYSIKDTDGQHGNMRTRFLATPESIEIQSIYCLTAITFKILLKAKRFTYVQLSVVGMIWCLRRKVVLMNQGLMQGIHLPVLGSQIKVPGIVIKKTGEIVQSIIHKG